MIPAGAESTAGDLPDVRERADRSKLPTNEWEGKMVSIFLLDLMERCERSQSEKIRPRTSERVE
jgi:hypothetical protein